VAVCSGALIAGGSFTRAGDTVVKNIARWDGSSWGPLGSGVDGPDPRWTAAAVLFPFESSLYAGGTFTIAGGRSSVGIGRWTDMPVAESPESSPPDAYLREERAVPNPFHANTTLSFTVPRSESVLLTIHDATGRRMATLFDGPAPEGRLDVLWNGRAASGGGAPPGVYFARLSVDARPRRGMKILRR
jgi:hypothetical protein